MEMTFCEDTAPIWRFVGYILFALKIIIPVVIIILGIMDFANAMIAKDEKAITNAAKSVGKRLILGIAIYFVPLLVSYIFSLIGDASPYIEKIESCEVCLLNPRSDDCRKAVNKANTSVNTNTNTNTNSSSSNKSNGSETDKSSSGMSNGSSTHSSSSGTVYGGGGRGM